MTKYRFGDVVLDTGDDDIILAPITTAERKSKGDYKIKNWQQSGLLLDSWLRLAKIACLSKGGIYKQLGIFSVVDKKQVILIWNKLYKFQANK